MSCEKFDPKCTDCRPAVIDAQTGQPFDANHPVVKAMNKVWDTSPLEEQEAYWRVMVKNSRDLDDIRLMRKIASRLEARVNLN
jgi:hypothetical protein